MNILVKDHKQKKKEEADRVLCKSRKEVEINGNGTTGYKIKEGSNKDKVLGHITIKSKEI
tara:strand:- start:9805 stop:9984 length:180 start_codon:yes stop_codon:yes gene_type:complete